VFRSRPRHAGRTGRAVLVGAATCLLAGAVSSAAARSSTVIRSANTTKYGHILEGPARYTLYVFCAGTSTRCTGTASSSFRPLIAHGKVVPAARSGVHARRLGTRRLRNGQRQVTYYGQPLYLYGGDRRPGQTRGEQKSTSRGAWFVISTGGRAVANGYY
jgi:predicted lipoprotein with Yx(FWY)xxD motif